MDKAYADFFSLQQDNFDAFVKSGTSVAKGFEQMTKHFADLTAKSFEDAVELSKKFAVAKTVNDVVTLQSKVLEGSFETMIAQGKKVKLIYTISNFHNPMGVTLAAERREQLIRVASHHGAFVLDDDAYGELYFPGWDRPPALSALSECHGVITVGTFSKIIATGLRVGWIHAEPEVLDRVTRVRFEMGNSPLLQKMLFEFSKDDGLDRHIEAMRKIYLRKLDTLCNALRDHCEPYVKVRRPHGGFFLWIELLGGLNGLEVQQAAIVEGLIAAAGYGFFPDRVDHGDHIRLAFSWVTENELVEAAKRLGTACAKMAERTTRA